MTVEDLSQYVVVVDPMEFVRLVQAASEAEHRAMRHDLDGQVAHAIREYSRAAAMIRSAVEMKPESDENAKVLGEHADQLQARVGHLRRLERGAAQLPIEEHIRTVRLSLDTPDLFGHSSLSTSREERTDSDAKVMGATAAISGAAALVLLGPVAGAAMGVAAALAASQEGHTGKTARKVGHAGVRWLATADKLNKEYKVSHSAVSAGRSVVKNTHEHAKTLLGRLGDGKSLSQIGHKLSILSSALI